MCEKLFTGRARRGEPVPGPVSRSGPGSPLSSVCPYSAKSGRPGRDGGSRYSEFVQISHTLLCAEIGGNQNDEIGAGQGRDRLALVPRPGQSGNRPILTGAAIGRQLVRLWPNSDRGSWNVKMVDGRPSGPRDSVFAASLVDCVWMLLCLPVTAWTGECWGHEALTGPRLSTRSLLNIETLCVSWTLTLTWAGLSHFFLLLFLTFRHKIRKPHKSFRHSTWPDWTQRFPVSRKTRLILDLEDYNYVVSLLGCNNPRHWVLTRHHPISNTSSNKLFRACSRFLAKTWDRWHYAGSWKHTKHGTPDAL